MKKWLHDLPTVNGIIYVLYTWMVIGIGIYMANYRGMKALLGSLVLVLLLVLVSWPFVYRMGHWLLKRLHIRTGEKHGRGLFLFFFGVTLVYLGIWYLAYYPGFYETDSMAQLEQAISGHYSDWHPVLHTLLVFTLPLKLTRGWIGSIILFQMVEFSLVMGYAFSCLVRRLGLRFGLISFLWIILNPITGNILMYPWKDITFAMCGICVMACVLDLAADPDAWLKRKTQGIWLGVILAVATILRHNAILFTLPILLGVCLLLKMWRKKWMIVLTFVLVLVAVRGPLYTALHVEKPDQRTVEVAGLPLTVLGNVVVEQPERLDAETRTLAYTIAPQELWEQYYQCGSFNTVKWQEGVNLDVIDEMSKTELVQLLVTCFREAPFPASRGLFTLIGFVSVPTLQFAWPMDRYMNPEEMTIPITGNSTIQQMLGTYVEVLGGLPVRMLYASIGLLVLLCGVLILSVCRVNRWKDWTWIFLAGAMVSYNLGTMLLLTGCDMRFFFVTLLVFPFAVALLGVAAKEK